MIEKANSNGLGIKRVTHCKLSLTQFEIYRAKYKLNFLKRNKKSVIFFSFLEISNSNFELLSKSVIYNPRNTLAPSHAQIRNIKLPKQYYKILL